MLKVPAREATKLSCRSPAPIDVAWCIGNLVSLYGPEAAISFITAWQEVEGIAEPYDPIWDLLVLAEKLSGPIKPYAPWASLGDLAVTWLQMIQRHNVWLVWLSARF